MKHIKTFRIFEKFLTDDLINNIIDQFGENPDIEKVVKYCYENFARITGLPEDDRNNSEAEFPHEIKFVIDRFGYDEPEFIDAWENLMAELQREEEDDLNWEADFDIRSDIHNLEMDMKDLRRRKKQLLIDMEQEAEPQGGKIADDYGDKLEEMDNEIAEVEKAILVLTSKLKSN